MLGFKLRDGCISTSGKTSTGRALTRSRKSRTNRIAVSKAPYPWDMRFQANYSADTFSADHCLNTLRKVAMCHGDVGLVIYSWQPGYLKPGANGTAHQCVNWPKLSTWANDRSINMYRPGLIVNPELGKSILSVELEPNSDSRA
jgi:hypothetical protein